MQPPKRDGLGIRPLTPDTTRVFAGSFSSMYCQVRDEPLYRGVTALLLFPIRHPERYIALRFMNKADEQEEIGVIEDLRVFPPESQQLIRATLCRQYYEQVIQRVFEVRQEHGLLFFDVQTQRGQETFMMYWAYDRAEEHGPAGKVLFDVFENRYLIPDLAALPPGDHLRLTNYIYW